MGERAHGRDARPDYPQRQSSDEFHLVVNFNDQFDFNSLASGERRHTYRGACMLASLAENLDHQIGETIDDFWLLHKGWIRVNHPQDLDDPLDLPEIVQQLLQYCQLIDGRQTSSFVTLFYRDIGTQFAGDFRAIGPPWSLTCEKDMITRSDTIDVVSDRSRWLGQYNA